MIWPRAMAQIGMTHLASCHRTYQALLSLGGAPLSLSSLFYCEAWIKFTFLESVKPV